MEVRPCVDDELIARNLVHGFLFTLGGREVSSHTLFTTGGVNEHQAAPYQELERLTPEAIDTENRSRLCARALIHGSPAASTCPMFKYEPVLVGVAKTGTAVCNLLVRIRCTYQLMMS